MSERTPDDWAVTPHDSADDPAYQTWRAARTGQPQLSDGPLEQARRTS